MSKLAVSEPTASCNIFKRLLLDIGSYCDWLDNGNKTNGMTNLHLRQRTIKIYVVLKNLIDKLLLYVQLQILHACLGRSNKQSSANE